jgi:catalase
MGRLVLNRNIDNFFAENELAARLLPGGRHRPGDLDLLLRRQAAADQGLLLLLRHTQRHRLGPNYLLLPANAPNASARTTATTTTAS